MQNRGVLVNLCDGSEAPEVGVFGDPGIRVSKARNGGVLLVR